MSFLKVIQTNIESPSVESSQQIVPRVLDRDPWPLYRSLNPAKGFTVWVAPERLETISWMSFYKNKFVSSSELMPSAFEMTISSFTAWEDVTKICLGLNNYNNSKMHLSYMTEFNLKIEGECFEGSLSGETLFLSKMDVNEKLMVHTSKSETIKNILQDVVETSAYFKGVRRVFIYSQNFEHSKMLEQEGYKCLSSKMNLETGEDESVFMKELVESKIVSMTGYKVEWELEPPEFDLPQLTENFGVFVRDEEGHSLGGVWGSFEEAEKVKIPHTHIDIFFLDEKIRGTGLGKLVMAQTEAYAKSRGHSKLILETMDFQAPWFYKKIGYQEIETLPKIFKDRNDQYVKMYVFTKEI